MSAGTERIPGDGPAAVDGTQPPPLPWRDAIRLRLTAEPEGRAESLVRYARWPAFGAGVLLLFLFGAVIPGSPCTAAAPCGPDRFGNVVIGLVVSIPLLALVRLEFAAAVTATMLVVTLGYELTQTEHLPFWFYLLLLGYAVACALVARLARGPRRHLAALRDWHGRAERAVPPSPARAPRPPLGTAVAATVLLAAALAVAGWTGLRQAEVDDQQRRAAVVPATVRSHPSWSEVELDFPDGRPGVRLSVYDAADYPVGATVDVAVDDAGLRQLVSEPYDLTPWLALVVVLGLLGLGVGWRGTARVRAGRRFFRRPQPISAVRVHQGVDRVYVYAGEGPEVMPLVEIEVRERLVPTTGAEPGPAILHGVPATGQWCTVTVDGRTLSPARPVLLPEPTAPFLTTRSRRVGVLLRSGRPVPPSRAGRKPERAGRRSGWPELTWVGTTLFVLLVLGAIVAGIVFGEPLLWRLADTVCTAEDCSTAALVTVGWAVVGLPLLVLGAAYSVLPAGSRLALAIAAVAVSVLAAGLSVALPDEGYGALRETYPELGRLYLGVLAGLGALGLGRAAAARIRPRGTAGTWDRPGGAGRTGAAGWYDRIRDDGLLPLAASAVLQVPALLVVLLAGLILF
ncbi:hypothetical protein [Plantactinospora endophytica]|uniref:Uncharacterized protein n=1 Tax=Plantactinospora endophytica TaxID=673535 RepID=A0ABQ4E414_9ACTN|nr:hypothetical protein [Plantactinospora endophytica]GIG89448.1 hypothetical protein Pen02_43840 [Plantactinospora endophytica]